MLQIHDSATLNVQLMTSDQIDKGLKLTKTPANPWKHWDVLVWKGKHCGSYHVIDVVSSKKTRSQMMLQVQTNTVNASGTLVAVDYNHLVDAEVLLPLHVIEPPPLALELPPGYVHPGLTGLQKQQLLLHTQYAQSSQPEPPRTVTPPPSKPSLIAADSVVGETDPWAPEMSLDPGTATNSPPMPPIKPWRSSHSSQHEFYELDQAVADDVLFLAKLQGTMPVFKDRKYKYNQGSALWFSVYFLVDSTTHTLAMDWQQIRRRLPNSMVIYPQWPTKNTNLPLFVTKGEFKDSVVTKVAGIGTNLHVLPAIASTGDVDVAVPTFVVSCGDCCVVRLQKSAHKQWSQNKVSAWQAQRPGTSTA
ncbi:hypothetical protein PQX77_002334 [Marasmius sp. AFHP31]|nr:hypothetical protein PQX77_002334 [Marasmius sp. AFHP31]